MQLSSLGDIVPSPTYSKLRRRYTVARNACIMTKELTGSCDLCSTEVITKTQQTSFRLSFEAKIVASLVFFAATVSICRTSTLLRHFESSYGARLLKADQSSATKMRNRLQSTDFIHPRVVLWNNADWILPLKTASTFQLYKAKTFNLFDDKYKDENDNDLNVDPTQQYDQHDSADLPTLERSKWPNHEFDPNCIPAASWQTTFHPTCNDIHSSADTKQTLVDGEFSLLSRKGYWRHAWLHRKEFVRNDELQYRIPFSQTVWKTLK